MSTTSPNNPADQTDIDALPSGADEASIPLGVGAFASEPMAGAFGAAAPARRIKSGSLVLILVVGLAAIGLFFMRTLTRVTAAASGHTQIETTIENFLKAVSQEVKMDPAGKAGPGSVDPTRVLNVLSSDFTDRQVPLSDVNRNPFIIYQFVLHDSKAGAGGGDEDEGRRAIEQRRARRLEAINQAIGRLRLKSIILGSEPLASLGGQIVRVGDIINVDDETLTLRVKEINKDSLVVATEEPELELSYESTLQLRLPQ